MAIQKSSHISDIDMNYAYFGSGSKNLIVIPGLSIKNVSSSASYIERMYKDYLDLYTVYVIDRRENIPDVYTIKDMADDTVKVIKSLGIDKFDLYAVSQGGMIALNIAAFYPEMVDKLVLASTSFRINDSFKKIAEKWCSLAESKNREGLACAFARDTVSPSISAQAEKVYTSMSSSFTDDELEKFCKLCKSFDTYDMEQYLNSIKCKSFIIGAKGDQLFPYTDMIKLCDLLNGKIFLYPENYGHAVYDEAHDFSKRLFSFLTED